MILTTLAALWTFACSGYVCKFDATPSTGTIRSYAWTFSDSTKASGVIVGHTFTHAGTFSVMLKVYDGVKYSQLTKKITVTAANVITRVDTVRLTRVDTLRLPSKPDTIRRVDTVRVGASMQFLLPWGPFVDSSRVGTTMVVHWTTFLGTLRKYEKGYVAYGQDSLPIVKGVPVPVSLDSAVSLLAPKSLSVKVGP